jgi:uncharacterized protein
MTIVSVQAAWMPKLEHEVRRYLNCESSGHDPWHAFRVRDLAIRIAQEIGAETEVVHAAALLHDIGHVSGRAEHAQRGASLAADLLSSCSFPVDKIRAVTSCIEQHHWLPGRAGDPQSPTLEYQAFADADRLDALGAIGVARTFAFGGAHGRPIWDPEPNAAAHGVYGVSSIHHFYDKLLRLPGDMYTKPGRRIAARRVTVMEEFLRTFYQEWEGKDADLNALGAESAALLLDAFPKRTIQVGDRGRRVPASVFQPDPIK